MNRAICYCHPGTPVARLVQMQGLQATRGLQKDTPRPLRQVISQGGLDRPQTLTLRFVSRMISARRNAC